jgi:hypothetical protein
MKTRIAIFAAVVAVFCGLASYSLYGGGLDTPQLPVDAGRQLYTKETPWILLRPAGAVDGTGNYTLTSEDMSWDSKVAGAANIAATVGMIDVLGNLGWGANAVEIAFFSVDDAENDDFDISIYAWKNSPHGPGVPVFFTTADACKVGTMACLKHPTLGTNQAAGKWVDTIAGTDIWSGVTVLDSGNNRIARLTFDLRGYRYILVRVWNDGGATAAAKIGAIITGY